MNSCSSSSIRAGVRVQGGLAAAQHGVVPGLVQHETRHDTVLGGSESALHTHTRRMLELEQEFIRRFPDDAAPEPLRTRAGSRHEQA